jgi:hypothetical protein
MVSVAWDPCVGAARSFLARMLLCDGPANSILVLYFSVICNPSFLLGNTLGGWQFGNCIEGGGLLAPEPQNLAQEQGLSGKFPLRSERRIDK